MRYSYSIEEIRRAEEGAIAGGTPSLVLMERAGKALAERASAIMKEKKFPDVLIVAGCGNNGGDGFAAAQILREEGKDAAVLCLGKKFTRDSAEMMKRYRGEIFGVIPRRRFAFILDCVLGTGLRSAPEGDAKTLIDFISTCGAYVLSCDLPSGLAENGVAPGACVRADETLSLGGLKSALLLADGADFAGKISVADLGMPLGGGTEVWESADVKALFPPRRSHSNKGNYGAAAILATCNMFGAPLLAVGGALRSGAGYTDLYLTSSSVPCEDRAKLAVFEAADEVHRTLFTAKYPACRFFFYDGEPIFAEAVAFGMGAGAGEGTRILLGELLSSYRGTLILDADALNTLAVSGKDGLKTKSCKVVITPHIKEFARLTGRTAEEVLSDSVRLAEAFAEEYGVTVMLKDNRTVITDGRRTAINVTGSSALAKGGSGDVLSGFLAGTCARGVPPFEAACAAAYLLGRAGELAAEELGEYSVTPTDVIERLPKAILGVTQSRRDGR